jgi:hypothetical protein
MTLRLWGVWHVGEVLRSDIYVLFLKQFGRVDPADIVLVVAQSTPPALLQEDRFAWGDADPLLTVVADPLPTQFLLVEELGQVAM